MYVRDREWVGASRWSWEDTVRLTGWGKNGSGTGTDGADGVEGEGSGALSIGEDAS